MICAVKIKILLDTVFKICIIEGGEEVSISPPAVLAGFDFHRRFLRLKITLRLVVAEGSRSTKNLGSRLGPRR